SLACPAFPTTTRPITSHFGRLPTSMELRCASTATTAAHPTRPIGTSCPRIASVSGGIVTRYFSAARPFSYLIFAGVFDRYPNLRMVGAEVDCGWVPFWVQTLVHHWEVQTSWFPVKLQHSPADF